MSREIISSKDILVFQNNADSGQRATSTAMAQVKDGYFDRLFKYIPAELVAGYIFVTGSVKQLTAPGETKLLSWLLFAVFTILTPLYLNRVQKVRKLKQLVVSTLSFVVWAFALGGPFALTEWYNPLHGSLLLPVFTLLIAVWEAD